MDLEILGAVSIRWVAKEKRRVEFVETPLEPTSIRRRLIIPSRRCRSTWA